MSQPNVDDSKLLIIESKFSAPNLSNLNACWLRPFTCDRQHHDVRHIDMKYFIWSGSVVNTDQLHHSCRRVIPRIRQGGRSGTRVCWPLLMRTIVNVLFMKILCWCEGIPWLLWPRNLLREKSFDQPIRVGSVYHQVPNLSTSDNLQSR